MVTNVELYEALKRKVGEEAARMIAEVVPPSQQLATKADVAELKGEIRAVEARLTRWMLTFFIPNWVGVWAVVLVLVLRG